MSSNPTNSSSSSSSGDSLSDEQIQDILEIENDSDYRTVVDNTVPNYVTDEGGPDDILKTEILICEKCMHPNIVGTEPFNRRDKELHHIKTDSVTYASISNFSKLNKLDMNATLSMLMRVVSNPDVSKMVMGTFSRIPKRRGKRERSRDDGRLFLHQQDKHQHQPYGAGGQCP